MTELKDQLSLLGRKTEYRQDYAPEVLEATSIPAMTTGCVSTAPNSPASVPSRGNRTLQKSVFAISPMSRW